MIGGEPPPGNAERRCHGSTGLFNLQDTERLADVAATQIRFSPDALADVRTERLSGPSGCQLQSLCDLFREASQRRKNPLHTLCIKLDAYHA